MNAFVTISDFFLTVSIDYAKVGDCTHNGTLRDARMKAAAILKQYPDVQVVNVSIVGLD